MKKMILLVAAVLIMTSIFPAGISAQSRRTVRVAYPIQEGLTDLDENGNYTGYTYEYLEEIAQYTGWDYEFVQVPGPIDESLTALMNMVETGEVDLIGGLLYLEDYEKRFNYASHSYGVVETVLQVLADNTQSIVVNSQVQQNFRIAVTNRNGRTAQELKDYCKMNLITPEFVDCTSQEEQIAAMREGRADMMLNTSLNFAGGIRTIARFSPKPFYFAVTKKDDSGLLEKLNEAITSIEQTDSTFSSTLFDKYFVSVNNTFMLSEKETDYLQSAGTLRVGYLNRQPPFQYLSEEGGFRGIATDLLETVSQKTGLKFECVGVDTTEELYRKAGAGEIDMVASMPYDYDLARDQELSMTRPYLTTQYVLLSNRSNESITEEDREAQVEMNVYPRGRSGKVVYYDTIESCIQAVETGGADYTVVDAYTAQYYINQPRFDNLRLVQQESQPRRICLGVVKSTQRELLSILNKAIVTMPEEDIQGIINQNVIQRQPLSMMDIIRENPMESLLVVGGFLLLVIAGLLVILRQRAKMNKKTSLELKKHFRVYALMNEYFYEYDFQADELLLSIPPKNEKSKPELVVCKAQNEQERQFQEPFMQLIRSQEDGVREVCLRYLDGQYHWLRIALETVYDDDKPAYALGKIHVIDDEQKEKDALLRKAQLDSLTQLYNAETCRNMVKESLAELREQENGALILVDVDHFKQINDTYGHMRGDETLVRISKLLRDNFRDEDIVGRPGGDEFLIYMRRIKNRQALSEKCAALCACVRALDLEDGVHLSISVGAAMSECGDAYNALYQCADQALYRAKEQGRDGFSIVRGEAGRPQ
ncbi:transporter substrate-binding domain-containing diguanylate cyclase [Candidatus Soleaferrea massiliensis]|uniref:transporter substrate-binding domain-containing diguanylate cyclase n=1 Tax=Candidatus Soleaferrea massiliensis TaxID=1470354 RepID=UPI00058AF09C|nr:transporter substrate-binding domain-containing protein [Candidatus Soleaferrea massiliensis]